MPAINSCDASHFRPHTPACMNRVHARIYNAIITRLCLLRNIGLLCSTQAFKSANEPFRLLSLTAYPYFWPTTISF